VAVSLIVIQVLSHALPSLQWLVAIHFLLAHARTSSASYAQRYRVAYVIIMITSPFIAPVPQKVVIIFFAGEFDASAFACCSFCHFLHNILACSAHSPKYNTAYFDSFLAAYVPNILVLLNSRTISVINCSTLQYWFKWADAFSTAGPSSD